MDDPPLCTLVGRDNDHGYYSHRLSQRVEEAQIQTEVGVEEWRSGWYGAVERLCAVINLIVTVHSSTYHSLPSGVYRSDLSRHEH